MYFTDQGQTGLHDPTGRVYRLCTDGRLDCLLANGPSPNGLVLTPDESALFVAMTGDNARCLAGWRTAGPRRITIDGTRELLPQLTLSYSCPTKRVAVQSSKFPHFSLCRRPCSTFCCSASKEVAPPSFPARATLWHGWFLYFLSRRVFFSKTNE
ncbi:hypothetical protein ACQ4P5_19195 [Ralstonia sp. L16]|uniref:hypothetical protein n=1 Tax=unclassified Ralstonia TaxID=209769 RepID=UPI003F7A77B7